MNITRDFTVAVFVVWQSQVLLHEHRKLGKWLPPGGHIEAFELPDEAAIREVLEEAGVKIQLMVSDKLEFVPESDSPQQLIRPRGIQLEGISAGHEHIDLIYFARPETGYDGLIASEDKPFVWCNAVQLETLPLGNEVRAWCKLVLQELS